MYRGAYYTLRLLHPLHHKFPRQTATAAAAFPHH